MNYTFTRPLPPFLGDPNPDMTWEIFDRVIGYYIRDYGLAYAWVLKGILGNVNEVWPLNPIGVWAVADGINPYWRVCYENRVVTVSFEDLFKAIKKEEDMSDTPSNRSPYDKPIQQHGGAKYLRKMRAVGGKGPEIDVDVYCVIDAFNVTNAGLQHALKKILCPGQRDKGTTMQDIEGALDALWRARELLMDQEARNVKEK